MKDNLDKMLDGMDSTELLIFYHASLKALAKKGINPREEKR